MNDYLIPLKPYSINRHVKKRTTVFYQSEIPRHAYMIRSGIIKEYSMNTAGEEQIIAFYTKGDMFPLPWMFNQTSSTLFHYETVTDCELVTFPKDKFLELLDTQPLLYKKMFTYFTNSYTGLLMRVRALEQSQAIEKIVFTLYYLMFIYGKESKPGVYTIELNLTQTTIASLVGLTRETTAARLNQLKRRGVITYKGHEYSVNKPIIEKYLGEDSFKDLIVR